MLLPRVGVGGKLASLASALGSTQGRSFASQILGPLRKMWLPWV